MVPMRLTNVMSCANWVLLGIAVALIAGPLFIISAGLTSDWSLLGFGRGWDGLRVLVVRSGLLAFGSAAVASVSAAVCAGTSVLDSAFAASFRRVALMLVMSNPLFMVLSMSTILVPLNASVAVFLVTAVVVFPLAAVVMLGFLRAIDMNEIVAAESLGATGRQLVKYNLVPGLKIGVVACVGLTSLYAVGFFLLPTLVGLGRVVTLGSGIHHAVSRVGDWAGASQLAALLSGLGFTLSALAVWSIERWHR